MNVGKIGKKILTGVSLVSLLGSLSSSCHYETKEEKCCSCLVGNNCTPVSKDSCLDIFYTLNKDSIPVDIQCVGKKGCYESCVLGGAYFKENRMVVEYGIKNYGP